MGHCLRFPLKAMYVSHRMRMLRSYQPNTLLRFLFKEQADNNLLSGEHIYSTQPKFPCSLPFSLHHNLHHLPKGTLPLTHYDWQRSKKLRNDSYGRLWLASHCASQSRIPSCQPFSEGILAFCMAGIICIYGGLILSIRIPP